MVGAFAVLSTVLVNFEDMGSRQLSRKHEVGTFAVPENELCVSGQMFR
jgi:hypothetical protein